MSIMFANSSSGNVKEALGKLKNPDFVIMFVSDANQFEAKVAELASAAPELPSLVCVANSYTDVLYANGVSVLAFDPGSIEVKSGLILEASTAPAKYIHNLEKCISSIHPGKDNTVCITFCTGHDAKVITTMQTSLARHNICETGGTVDQAKVAYCGKIYEDAAVYILAKNKNGKVKTFKENLYKSDRAERFIASDTDISNYYVGKLNGRSAKEVYKETLGINDSDMQAQTFVNPLGKMVGDECYIVSVKDISGNGITCYKQVNDSDILSILDIQDTQTVVNQTISEIESEFHTITGIFSVNCIFRFLYLDGKGEFSTYLKMMSQLKGHHGYIGYGEHLDCTFVNQTMACVVFGN